MAVTESTKVKQDIPGAVKDKVGFSLLPAKNYLYDP
jgi:hypothetical protein